MAATRMNETVSSRRLARQLLHRNIASPYRIPDVGVPKHSIRPAMQVWLNRTDACYGSSANLNIDRGRASGFLRYRATFIIHKIFIRISLSPALTSSLAILLLTLP